MCINHNGILKIIYLGVLLPTYVLTLEKVCLIPYPRLTTILNNNNNSAEQTNIINQYLNISQGNNQQTFIYSDHQKSYITLGLYLFLNAKNPNFGLEKNQCISEANQSFNQAFKHPNTFNINLNTPINDVCRTLENALWWDYYLNKIPFIKDMLQFVYQIRNINKYHDF